MTRIYLISGVLILIGLILTFLLKYLSKVWKFGPFVDMSSTDNEIMPSIPSGSPQNAPEVLLWDTPKNAYHSTRVLCDNAGLTLDEKNLICACVYQESQFHNTAKNENKNAQGKVLSTDWGLAQINDYYHIGVGKDFPSVQYVLDNPDKVIEWMIKMYKNGLLKQWVSFSSGAYRKWLLPVSPMWLLA